MNVIQAAAPLVQDAVVTGHDREEIGLLLFPSELACRQLCSDLPADAPMSQVVRSPEVIARVKSSLAKLAADSTGGSTRPTRALLMAEPASAQAGEITDKGYINQRLVLQNRTSDVSRLYQETPDPAVLVLT